MSEDFKPQLNYVPENLEGGSLGSVDDLKPNTMPPEFGNAINQTGGDGAKMVGNGYQTLNFVQGARGAGWRLQADGKIYAQDILVNNVQAGGVIEITATTVDNLQDALDNINTQGGGTLRLSPGTYTVNNDLVVYDNTFIEGDSSGNTTITFASQAYGITYTGTDVYTTGTLSVNQGSTTVTGSGTTWTSAMIGRQIFISNRWYVIANVGSTTSITLATAFADANVSGGTYRIADPINNVGIRNLTITGSTTNAIEAIDIRDMQIYDVVCVSNNVGISLTNFMNIVPELITVAASTSHGVVLTNGSFCNVYSMATVSNGGSGVVTNNIKVCPFQFSAANSNTADGYNCTDTLDCAFEVEVSGNGGQGIELVSGCDRNFINIMLVNGNTSDGIKLTATSDNNIIGSLCNIINNGGYGINIAASSCNNNCIFAPYFSNNTSGAYTDSGTNTDIITRTTAAAGGVKQYIYSTDVTIANTVTETALFTTSIAANTLGTNNGVKGRLYIGAFDFDAGHTFTVKLKYGSTTVVTMTITENAASAAMSGWLDFILVGDGGTSAQQAHILGYMSSSNNSTVDVTPGDNHVVLTGTGTATEDSTGALNLSITGQWSNASATDTITVKIIEVTIIK